MFGLAVVAAVEDLIAAVVAGLGVGVVEAAEELSEIGYYFEVLMLELEVVVQLDIEIVIGERLLEYIDRFADIGVLVILVGASALKLVVVFRLVEEAGLWLGELAGLEVVEDRRPVGLADMAGVDSHRELGDKDKSYKDMAELDSHMVFVAVGQQQAVEPLFAARNVRIARVGVAVRASFA